MMDTEQLIEKLVSEGPQKPLPHPFRQALFWMTGTIAYLVALSAYLGLRPDLADKMADSFYLLELALLLATAITACVAALCLSRPDSCQMPRIKYVPFAFLALWALVAFGGAERLSGDSIFHAMTTQQFDCPSHIALFSLPPAVAIFMIVHRGATVQCLWTGSMAILAVTAFAYLVMRLIEQNDDPAHLIVWHAFPIVLICAIGMMAGKRLLRWR